MFKLRHDKWLKRRAARIAFSLMIALAAGSRAGTPADGFAYTFAMDGLKLADNGLRAALLDVSRCASLRNQPPANLAQLRRRAEEDVEAMQAVLRARGLYAGRVEADIQSTNMPAAVRFIVQPGPAYALGRVRIEVENARGQVVSVSPPRGLRHGEPARADAIAGGTERVLDRLREQGHPYPKLITRLLTVDDAAHAVDLELFVRAGPNASFGPIHVQGLSRVDLDYVLHQCPWDAGERYQASLVREYERRLLASGLFATMRMEVPSAVEPSGDLPLTVTLAERRRRTVRLSLRYSSDVGAGTLASWEHRNLFGGGESLRLSAELSEQESGVGAIYRQPAFLRADQALVLDTSWKREESDAYDSDSAKAEASIERRLNGHVRAGAGAGYLYSIVTQLSDTERYGFMFFPLRAYWDKTDDMLDPENGTRLRLEFAPYANTLDQDLTFWRNTAEGSYYIRVLKAPRLVFAHRVAAGWVVGASREDLPADLRFYAGGGGSVRGYEYQTIGDLEDDTPLGGSSMLETSLELRARVNERLGLVAFTDGGAVYENAEPASDGAFRWSAGFGVRYYSGIGPFRFDVAFPLDPRDRDDPFALYVSLGQAF